MLEIVYYDYLYEDRAKRINQDKRKAILIVDTDSNFLHLDNLYKHIVKTYNLDPNNTEQKGMILMIFIHMLEEVVKKTYWTMTTNMGLHDDYKEIIRMKSEFLYSRVMVTNAKKNYAGNLIFQEGALFKKPRLDMKGLPIKKSNVPRTLRQKFFEILEEYILRSEKINLKEIIEKFNELSGIIKDSLNSGSLEYSLPKSVDAVKNYKVPYTQPQVRGALAWNYLFPNKEIKLPEKVNLMKLNCESADDPRLVKLKETHPKEYNIIREKIFEVGVDKKSPYAKYGFTNIAVPQDEEQFPDFLVPFISVDDIVDTNIAAALSMLESLGIVTYKSTGGSNKRTNIIEI